jgi:hypothetical protein
MGHKNSSTRCAILSRRRPGLRTSGVIDLSGGLRAAFQGSHRSVARAGSESTLFRRCDGGTGHDGRGARACTHRVHPRLISMVVAGVLPPGRAAAPLNRVTNGALMTRRRAKPPSPSPSLPRRRTPALLASGRGSSFRLATFGSSLSQVAGLAKACRMSKVEQEEMNGGHTPGSHRDHRFGSLRGRARARRQAMPGRPHLSGLQ